MEMERRFGIKAEQSKFYAPHWIHDKKYGVEKGHTDAFDEMLASLIIDDVSLEEAKRQASLAFRFRYQMQDQFLSQRRIPHVTHLG
jgi:hypothetical protein